MAEKKASPRTEETLSASPYNSAALDDIRRKIDALDDRIHDTLMERAALVLEVGKEKKKNNIQIVQPAREARMIRRLLARHGGALPAMAVVRIWRELVGAVSLLQTGLKVTVAAPEGQHEYHDLARDYFGSCLPMQKASTAVSAISSLKDGKATFAVLPRPSIEDEQPWWAYLEQSGQDPLRIITSLPHGVDPANPNPDRGALVVAKCGFDASGNDNSFILIQCDASVSRAKLVDLAQKASITALALYSKRNTSQSLPSIHLMEVRDYVPTDDARLKNFLKLIEDPGAGAFCVGGYPVPVAYGKTVRAFDADAVKAAS